MLKKDSKSFALLISSAQEISRFWKLNKFKEDWINEYMNLFYSSSKTALYEQLVRSYAEYESGKISKINLTMKINIIQGDFEKLPELMKKQRESDEFLIRTFFALKDLTDDNTVHFECPYCKGVAHARKTSLEKFYAYCTSCNTIRTRDRI
ncbi:MAG: hypothetical protein Q8934_08785 [Bacillota bacterium]|nr:hypothetical protein [Bacillota bacterium]